MEVISNRDFAKLIVILTALLSSPLYAFELKLVKVTTNAYALVGATTARTYENHALNTTLGFVITENGVVLIDSGASRQGAALIEQAINTVTEKPIRWVINTGVQDHKWLGNEYFVDKGAKIIALARTVAEQKARADDHLARLATILKERLKGTRAVHAPVPLPGDRADFVLDGQTFKIIWPGAAHFAGDVIVWIPEQRVMFTGDLVFTGRMLGILPMSNALSWQKAFHVMAAFNPLHVVPGHGKPGSMKEAKSDTGDYLDWLIANITPQIKDWVSLEDTVEKLADAPFRHLQHFDNWHRINVNRAYLQLESGQ